MNILIAYAGKTGTTKTCAHMLADKLNRATVVDLNKENINPEKFEIIVVGSSVRMGMIQKSLQKWLKENWEVLKQRKLACFICNGFVEQEKQILAGNFSQEFMDHAFYVRSFGGELDVNKLKGFDKFVAKNVMRSAQGKAMGTPKILEDRIAELANEILGL
ncbi:MAG: flavodoxin domain-containing protein [Lachnospiraceae bacterium]|nr:flavodoxin domain-containing protein [Lachnospiraceae bacterium]